MQKSGIEWTNYTNNTVTGCLRGCDYCYARDVAENPRFKRAFPNGFKLTYHPERVMEPAQHKRPELVFADSMSDLFGDGVKQEWVSNTFCGMESATQHIFQILTKTPENIIPLLYNGESRFKHGDYLENVWIGVTVDRAETLTRINELKKILTYNRRWHLFVSFEPLLSEMPESLGKTLNGIDWVIVGQRTKPFNYPKLKWVGHIIDAAKEKRISVFIKNNLYCSKMGKDSEETYIEYLMQDDPNYRLREFPMEMCNLFRRQGEYDAIKVYRGSKRE